MDCKQIRDGFSDYFDGLLPNPEQEPIREHLKGCVACRREYQRFSAAVRAMRELPEVKAPPNFVYLVQERLDRDAAWFRRAASFLNHGLNALPLRSMTAVATAVLVLTILLVSQDNRVSKTIAGLTHHEETVPASLVGATDPVPVEFASTNPSHDAAAEPAMYDNPTEFLMQVVKSDPNLKGYDVYPHHRGTGVIIHTPDRVLEVEMDPAEFPIIQAYVEQQGLAMPTTLRQARTMYPIYVRALPSPTAPLEP
ncbi:MAG TPA: zf-HC2 domain-containing protein [bacterium]|nr:zf-HC2 domain-containing protein [bacterium]